MAPNTLRVVSFFFLAAPVAGLFTGYYRKMGLVAIFQTMMYFFSFMGLRAWPETVTAVSARLTKPRASFNVRSLSDTHKER
jgi:hypothetical protein